MRHIKGFFGVLVLSILLFSSCQKDATNSSSLNGPKSSAKSSPSNALVAKAKFDKMMASLPAGYEKRLERNERFFLKQHPQYREYIQRAIVPTPCDANTSFNMWVSQELSDWDDDIFFFAAFSGMLDFPTYDALLFENSSDNQYFGRMGEYTHSVTKAYKDLQRFWNIQTDGIVLAAMHGAMLRDRDRLIRIDMILFGDPPDVAAFWADLILAAIEAVPQYRNGDHPIFTLNAYALNSFPFPPFGIIPDKIVMGDGILEAYTALGYGDVAPQAVLAHEFGHHIQFQLNLFSNIPSPEATRRTELMADAYAAYYLSHSRGASMQMKRVRQFLQVFYNIGDCQIQSFGHHGTPLQRMAAAEFGFAVVNNAPNQGHILTAQQFTALFEAQLAVLVGNSN